MLKLSLGFAFALFDRAVKIDGVFSGGAASGDPRHQDGGFREP
jgi:hypothetical protein